MRRKYNAIIGFVIIATFISGAARADQSDVTLLAVGDIMLSRHIRKVITSNGGDFHFEGVSSILKEGDIVFGNLESILSDKNDLPLFKKPYNFAAPIALSKNLKKAGFNLLRDKRGRNESAGIKLA